MLCARRTRQGAIAVTSTITAQDILDEIKPFGTDGYKRILMKHGIKEPVYGVKIEELKAPPGKQNLTSGTQDLHTERIIGAGDSLASVAN